MTTLIDVGSCPPKLLFARWTVYVPEGSSLKEKSFEVEGFQEVLMRAQAISKECAETVRCGATTKSFVIDANPDGTHKLAWRVRHEFIDLELLDQLYDSDPGVKRYLLDNGLLPAGSGHEEDGDEW